MTLLKSQAKALARLLLRLTRQLPAMLWLQRWLDLVATDTLLWHSARHLWPLLTTDTQLRQWGERRMSELATQSYGPFIIWRVLLYLSARTWTDTDKIQRQAEQKLCTWLAVEYGIESPSVISNLGVDSIIHRTGHLSTKQQLLLFIHWLRDSKSQIEAEKLLAIVLSKLTRGFSSIFLTLLNQQQDRRWLMQQLVQVGNRQRAMSQALVVKLTVWLNGLWSFSTPLDVFVVAWQRSLVSFQSVQHQAAVVLQQLRLSIWFSLLARPQQDLSFWQLLLADVADRMGFDIAKLKQSLITTHMTKLIADLADIVADVTEDEARLMVNIDVDSQGDYLSCRLIVILTEYWLVHGRAPLWLAGRGWSLTGLIADLYRHRPQLLVRVLRNLEGKGVAACYWHNRLFALLDFEQLLHLAQLRQPSLKGVSAQLVSFYQAMGKLSLTVLDPRLTRSTVLMQLWSQLLAMLLKQSASSSYTRLMPARLMLQLIEQWTGQFGIDLLKLKVELKQQLKSEKLDLEVSALLDETVNKSLDPQLIPDEDVVTIDIEPIDTTMPMAVTNAGLVILNGFVKRYFDFLALLDDGEFKDQQAQLAAVHYLQFLVTGHEQTDEQHLLLNKLMVGLPLETAVERGITVTDAQRELAQGLINSLIQHWRAIGSSSIEGFRGNWLIRDGVLTEHEDHWHLLVEKRPYDLLLDRLPFGFSQVKLPWMDKAIVVDWPR